VIVFGLTALSFTLGSLLFLSVRKNFQLIDKLDEVTTQVEESLDLLDEYHMRIDMKSKAEVLFDDPLVKDLIQDIKGCKNAVLLVANKVYSPLEDPQEENEEGTKP
jgi:hypothetical protein